MQLGRRDADIYYPTRDSKSCAVTEVGIMRAGALGACRSAWLLSYPFPWCSMGFQLSVWGHDSSGDTTDRALLEKSWCSVQTLGLWLVPAQVHQWRGFLCPPLAHLHRAKQSGPKAEKWLIEMIQWHFYSEPVLTQSQLSQKSTLEVGTQTQKQILDPITETNGSFAIDSNGSHLFRKFDIQQCSQAWIMWAWKNMVKKCFGCFLYSHNNKTAYKTTFRTVNAACT